MTISSPISTDWLDRDVSHAAGAKRRVVMNPSRLASGSVPNMTSRLQMQHGPAGVSVFGQRLNPPCLCLKKMRCHVFAADPLRRDMRAAPVIDMQVDPKRAEAGNLERMRARRLHVQSLSERDIGKVAMFLRVGRERLRCEWEIVFGGDLDVLMLGGDEPDTVVGAIDGPVATLRVVDGGAGGCAPGVLLRPLQYDAFVDALSALELGVVSGPHADLSPVPPTVATVLPQGGTFRLRRWPPHAVLQGRGYHVHLASCMLARHVGIDELVRLSNVSRLACEEFLATLIEQNMLDLRSVNDAQPPMAAATVPRTAAPAPVRSLPDIGLLAKMRRGLGLLR